MLCSPFCIECRFEVLLVHGMSVEPSLSSLESRHTIAVVIAVLRVGLEEGNEGEEHIPNLLLGRPVIDPLLQLF